MIVNILEKNPFLECAINKNYTKIRCLEILWKIFIVIIYFLLKPFIISYKRKCFIKFQQCECLFKLNRKKTKFYLPNLYWKKNMVEGEYIQKRIYYLDNYYEMELLKKIQPYINSESIVMDIGANIGNHTIFFAKECEVKKIYSFEPVTKTYNILKKNVEINNLEDKITLFNAAVGKTNGYGQVQSFCEENFGSSRITTESEGDIKVFAIDDLSICQKIDFIKIDIEGSEYNALLGMKNTLLRDKPDIFIEIWDINYKIVNDFLLNLDYSLMWKEGDNYFYTIK